MTTDHYFTFKFEGFASNLTYGSLKDCILGIRSKYEDTIDKKNKGTMSPENFDNWMSRDIIIEEHVITVQKFNAITMAQVRFNSHKLSVKL